MTNSKNITATSGRLNNVFNKVTSNAIEKTVPAKITEAVNNEKIRTGVITKFYPYLDKAEVRLDNGGKTVLCKILHRYGGDVIDFYTPLEDHKDYDSKLHEPFICPRAEHHVCVLNIHDDDSTENLILGYYQNDDIVGYNPAQPGNVKIMSLVEDNQYWLKFGADGFDYRGITEPTLKVGDVMDEMNDVAYANSDNVYTKEEVDELIDEISPVDKSYNNGVLIF